MIRIPNSYYTHRTLDGNPASTPEKTMSPVFNQGDDILLCFYMTFDGKPVRIEDWTLTAIVKKSPYASNILFLGKEGAGIFKKDTDGYYSFLMPSEISSLFLAGTYYLDIKGVQKLGTGAIKDLTVVLMSATFNIELTSASPNPTLRAFSNVVTSIDPETGIATYTITSVETTMPPHVDTSNP